MPFELLKFMYCVKQPARSLLSYLLFTVQRSAGYSMRLAVFDCVSVDGVREPLGMLGAMSYLFYVLMGNLIVNPIVANAALAACINPKLSLRSLSIATHSQVSSGLLLDSSLKVFQ